MIDKSDFSYESCVFNNGSKPYFDFEFKHDITLLQYCTHLLNRYLLNEETRNTEKSALCFFYQSLR